MIMVFKRVHHPNLEDVLGSTLKNQIKGGKTRVSPVF